MNKPTVYKRDGSPFWWFSWSTEEKRYRRSGREWGLWIDETSEREALRIVMLKLKLIDETASPDQATLDWFRDETLARIRMEGLRPGTIKEYRIALDHLVGIFGENFALKKLTRYHVGEFQRALASKGTKPPTINKICRHVQAAIERFVDDEFLEKNPFRKYTRLREVPTGPRHLTRDQIHKFFEVVEEQCPERFKYLMIISAFLGIRRQEVLEILREDIDLDRGRVKVMNVKRHDRPMRWLKIPDTARGAFEWFLEHGKGERPLKVCHPDTFTHWTKDMLRAADLPESLKLHSFRHTFITLAGESGVELWRLQLHVGHVSSRTTEGYFHPDANIGGAINIGIDLNPGGSSQK